MNYVLQMLLGLMRDTVNFMKDFEIIEGISLFNFLIALAVMSIVITYLVNVARRPTIETGTAENRRLAREKRRRKNV